MIGDRLFLILNYPLTQLIIFLSLFLKYLYIFHSKIPS